MNFMVIFIIHRVNKILVFIVTLEASSSESKKYTQKLEKCIVFCHV